MMNRCARRLLLLATVFVLGGTLQAQAAARFSVATNNWSNTATWGTACGGAGGASVPAANDTVTICNATTVTLNVNSAVLASLTVNSGGTLTLSGTAAFDLYLGGNLTNNGTINFQGSTGTNTIYLAGANVTSTFSGTGTWLLDNIDLNGTGTIPCTGACKVELSGSPSLQFISATLFAGNSATYTFNALGNSTATVTFNRAGAQTLSTTGVTYPNLVLAGSNVKTPVAGTLNIRGSLTIGAGTTFAGNTNNPTVNLGGSFSNSGTFTSGTGTYTFNGTGSQTIGGSVASTFTNLTVNKASGDVTVISASAALSPTVSGTLTLTSGKVFTTIGTNDIGIGTAGTISGASAASYVVGAVQKNYSAAGTFTFPVGDAANYTPVAVTGTAGFTAGSLTVSTTGGDHPSIGSSAIVASRSVNRYWTLSASGLSAGSTYNATFNYINGSPVDMDAGAVPANFIVSRWSGASWFSSILNPACTATPVANLCKQITGETSFGDFAIGEPLPGFNPTPGDFSAFESSTPGGSIAGRIYTKIVGTAITLDIVAVNAARTGVLTTYSTNPITVDLLDARDNTGALTAATNCRTSWTTVIQTQTLSPTWTSGRATVTITAPANAGRDVRVRVTQAALRGCSADRFAIRPTGFTGISSNMTNNGTSGGPSLKTGQNFTISALTGLSGYDNGAGSTLASPQIVPLLDSTKVVGSPTAGSIGGSFSAASAGTASGAAFFYSEVGNFGLNANAVYDNVFTAVDQPGDCTADFSNALVGGQYGCYFGSAAIPLTIGASGFGRFTPDNFQVSVNTPQFSTACAAGLFTYVGQKFAYVTSPVITVTARNGTNNGLTDATTANYAGAYVKFSNAAGTSLNQAPYDTQGGRYARFDALGGGATPALDTAGLPATTADPVIGVFAAGTGTLTFASGTGLGFARNTTTPHEPFDADIALALNVVDTDGVAYAANPATVGAATAGNGIAFSAGKNFRFGILRLNSAYGSELLPLRVPVQAMYWSGGRFVPNTNDSCTQLAPANAAIGNCRGPLASQCTGAGGTPNAGTVVPSFSATTLGTGQTTLILTRPACPGSAANCPTGSIDLALNLTGTATDVSCNTTHPASTGAGLTWLEGKWGGSTACPSVLYDRDPNARATFGSSRSRFVYFREMY